MTECSLFTPALAGTSFAGPESRQEDQVRLVTQLDRILHVAGVGDWWTVQRLTARLRKLFPEVGFPENSVQAQLRNLRKLGHTVERRHVAGTRGLFEYRVSRAVENAKAVAHA